MADPENSPKIRVTALQDKRRRAGQVFSKQPRDLAPADLGEGEDGFRAFAAILTDPQLKVSLVDEDGNEELVGEEQIEHAKAVLAALDDGSIDDDEVLMQLFDIEVADEPEPTPTPAPAPTPTPAPAPAKKAPAKEAPAKKAPAKKPAPKKSPAAEASKGDSAD